jgi:hypothetical protein
MGRLFVAVAVLLAGGGPALADDNARATLGGYEFITGGIIELDGRVRESAFVSGGDVNVGGQIGRNLYAAGGDVRLAGQVNGDARMAGGKLRVSPEARVDGDLTLAGGSIVVDGAVGEDLGAYGERITVNGSVGGDVELAGEELRVGPDARIAGELVYRSSDEIVVEQGAQVAGGVHREAHERRWERAAEGASIVGGIALTLGMVLLGALLVLGMPQFSREAGAAIRLQPWHSLGLGCAMLLGVPLLLVMLVVTIIGIPLAVVLAFGYAVLLALGYLVGAIFLADFTLERIDPVKLGSAWWRTLFLLLAVVGIALVNQVPIVGEAACFLLFLAGVGAFTLRAWRGFRNDSALAAS